MSKSEGQVLNFEKICRLCLVEKRSMSAIFTKKKSDKKVPLPVRIMSCASLELYEGDGLPASICSKCLQSVNQSYAFREQCEQADTTLRQYAQQMNEASEETSTTRESGEDNFSLEHFEDVEVINEEQFKGSYLNYDSNLEVPDAIVSKEGVHISPEQLQISESVALKGVDLTNQSNTKVLKEAQRNLGYDCTAKDRKAKSDSTVIRKLTEEEAKNIAFMIEVPPDVKDCDLHKVIGDLLKSTFNTKEEFRIKREFSCEGDRMNETCFADLPQKNKEWEEICKRICVSRPKPSSSPSNEMTVVAVAESGTRRWKQGGDTIYCKPCKTFLLRSSYTNHVKFVHKKIRKHLCQSCGYTACTGSMLRTHIQAVHVGYSFSCDLCGKKFKLKKTLRKHVESQHLGKPIERNHVCQYCGMAFTTSGKLKNHIRSHTQETPYECPFCGRKFKTKWAKTQHERLHTGEKPYKCSFCERRFTQNCVRKTHELKEHLITNNDIEERLEESIFQNSPEAVLGF